MGDGVCHTSWGFTTCHREGTAHGRGGGGPRDRRWIGGRRCRRRHRLGCGTGAPLQAPSDRRWPSGRATRRRRRREVPSRAGRCGEYRQQRWREQSVSGSGTKPGDSMATWPPSTSAGRTPRVVQNLALDGSQGSVWLAERSAAFAAFEAPPAATIRCDHARIAARYRDLSLKEPNPISKLASELGVTKPPGAEPRVALAEGPRTPDRHHVWPRPAAS